MREVAARIIQHHFRERRKRPSASGSARWPATPPAPPASCSSSFARKASVLDFMPGPRPASVVRPASRPPRPRAPSAVAKPAPSNRVGTSGTSQTSSPEVEAVLLEDSAERVSRESAAAKAAAAAVATDSTARKAAATCPVPRMCDSRAASPPPSQHAQQATRAAASGRPFSPTARQLQMGDVRASASTEKMGHIMRMIAELEKQAVEEARQVAPPPAVPPPQPRLQAQQQEQQAKSPTSTAHPIARVLAAQALSIGSKQIVAAAATDPVAAGALRAAEASTMVRKQAQLLTTPSRPAAASTRVAAPSAKPPVPDRGAEPAPAPAPAPTPQPPAPPAGQLNAAAVASSVRAKIQQLQQQVADKDGQLAELRQQAQAARREQAVALRAAEASHKVRGQAAARARTGTGSTSGH